MIGVRWSRDTNVKQHQVLSNMVLDAEFYRAKLATAERSFLDVAGFAGNKRLDWERYEVIRQSMGFGDVGDHHSKFLFVTRWMQHLLAVFDTQTFDTKVFECLDPIFDGVYPQKGFCTSNATTSHRLFSFRINGNRLYSLLRAMLLSVFQFSSLLDS